MAIYKHVSSKEIIRKVFRDLKPATADWLHDGIEWIGEALEHIGASSQLCMKKCVIDIENYTGKLPGDLYFINQVAINTCVSPATVSRMNKISSQISALNSNLHLYYTELNKDVTLSANGTYNSTLTPEDLEAFDSQDQSNRLQLRELNSSMAILQSSYFNQNGNCLSPLQYGTDTFHSSLHCEDCVNEFAKSEETYIVNCGAIKTSFVTGQICISYMAFPVDENCWPMVPDDISYREAMMWYIVKKLKLGGYKLANEKISYEYAENEWRNYCTQARNAANYPDIDRYQSFMDQWVRLVPNMNSHSTFFKDLNTREQFTPDNI